MARKLLCLHDMFVNITIQSEHISFDVLSYIFVLYQQTWNYFISYFFDVRSSSEFQSINPEDQLLTTYEGLILIVVQLQFL